MWWGKIIGLTLGLIVAGWLGGMIGFILGHLSDVSRQHRLFSTFSAHHSALQQMRKVFFDTTFLVMGHVAKADGRVTEEELNATRDIMHSMSLNDEQKRQAMLYFNQGKNVDFDLDNALTQLIQLCRGNLILLQMFVDLQFRAAHLSGWITPEKEKVLQHIFQRLHCAPAEFVFSQPFGQQRYYQAHSQTEAPASKLKQAYTLLGVSENASEADIKRAYRKLMSQHHPDKLVAKGLPEEMMKLATEKAQDIQLAYDLIRQAKGF